jgi:1,4-dihydroxy-6-naphthoate synthase
MGDGYGPRLVSRQAKPEDPVAALCGLRVAVPGKLTTAYLALKLFQPDVVEVVLPFDQIEAAVRDGTVDVGLVIHEGQLTYADEGFTLWGDLGAWWLSETGLPLPLGGNVVRRDLGPELVSQIAADLRRSIEFGLAHRQTALAYAKRFNRGIGDDRTDAFVGMYVNEWTVDYGPRGREAVRTLLERGAESGIIPAAVEVAFAG